MPEGYARSMVARLAVLTVLSLVALVAAEAVARVARWVSVAAVRLAEPSRTALSGLSAAQWREYDRLSYAELEPYIGFAPVRNFRSVSVNTNELGFRGLAPMAEKAVDTRRIAVLGGSAAFGIGASADAATFPAVLERTLRERGRRVEVINAAAPAYVSGQELARLTFQVLDLAPDVLVIYDGFNDINSALMFDPRPGYPSNFRWLEAAVHLNSLGAFVRYRVSAAVWGSGLAFWARRLSGVASDSALTLPGADADAAIVAAYRYHLETMVWMAQARGMRVLCVFQPTLVAKARQSAGERRVLEYIEQRHPGYLERFRGMLPMAVTAMGEACGRLRARVVDLSPVFDNVMESVFFDTAHVRDAGNAIVAARLAPEVEGLL